MYHNIIADEQASAQVELNEYVEVQTQSVAPQITTVEISFYDHEIYAQGKQIAAITHDPDDFQTQRWVVMVGETEIHRADSWAKCHSYISWHYKQGTLPADDRIETVSPEIEIDSDYDPDFGTLYRVWSGSVGINLLGTFCRAIDGLWVAQPCDSNDRPRCNTPAEAQLIIVTLAGLRASDSGDDGIDLLNKPVDELTVAEWQALKLAAQQAELVAA